MANEAASIAVRIGADLAPLQQGLAKGSDSVTAFSAKSVRQLRGVAEQAVKVGAAATAAGAAILAGLYVKGSKAIDAQAKLARSLNTTVDSLKAVQVAASLGGLEGMDGALTRLNRRLGAAEFGAGDAAVTVKALNLDLKALSEMPVDERLASIADTIRDSGLSFQQAARHLQNLGFEQKEATQFFIEGGDAIRSARRDVELFGLSLSDIDAAKVEQANGAMSTIGMATDGLIQQFTVELAPIVQAVADKFRESAEEAGGFDSVATTAVSNVLGGLGHILDVGESVRRTFEVAGLTITGTFARAEYRILGAINAVVQAEAKLKGFFRELSPQEQAFAENLAAAVEEARQISEYAAEDIHAILMEPMPSAAFDDFISDAKAASAAAAEAAVKAREAAGGGTVATLDDARTPAEQEAIQKRLEAIRQANLTEIELLKEKQAEEMALIAQARELGLETKVSYDQLEKEAEARHQQELTEIEQRAADARLRVAEQERLAKLNTVRSIFGQTSALMNSESRKMFEIGKAAAYGTALINTYQGISEAWKLGPILGPPMAALVALNGFAQVQNIRKQKFGGGASSPTGSVTGQINAGNTPVQSTQEQQRNLYVTLQGINPNSFVQAGTLVSALNEELENGGRIRGMGFAA